MLLIIFILIGVNLDNKSIIIGQILCVGVFSNAIASMYFSLIQARGRADITSKIHMFELPLYLIALLFCSEFWGLIGVASAWTSRLILDLILLYFFRKI